MKKSINSYISGQVESFALNSLHLRSKNITSFAFGEKTYSFNYVISTKFIDFLKIKIENTSITIYLLIHDDYVR
jgi:hypothetical protein